MTTKILLPFLLGVGAVLYLRRLIRIGRPPAVRFTDLIAKPGDHDLDIDLDGLTVTAVVTDDRHILVRYVGGFGSWVCDDGTLAAFAPGDGGGVTEAESHLILDHCSDDEFGVYVERLEGWRDRAVPLRLCGAPDRMFTVIEDRATWLPMPRRPIEEYRA